MKIEAKRQGILGQAMKCQMCDNPATIHMTDIVNKKKRETHLCEACAKKESLMPDETSEVPIPALLNFVLQNLTKHSSVVSDIKCEECEATFTDIKTKGRLGCPHDYELFREQLLPLIQRAQGAQLQHAGKIPERHKRRLYKIKKAELKALLKQAIDSERYEEAARYRDELQELRSKNES